MQDRSHSSFIIHRSSLLAVVAAIQLWLAHRYFGFLTGDDLEVIEEAFRHVRHIHFTPWDVRNLFVPDFVVAPVVWLATRLGVDDVGRIIELASLPFIALTAITIVLVRRLALQWSDGDERAAMLAMLLFAFHWIPLGFGSTVYPRTLAMACIVAAAVAVERAPLLAGVLVGIAFADRFSEIVFVLPLMVTAGIPRKPSVILSFAQGDTRQEDTPDDAWDGANVHSRRISVRSVRWLAMTAILLGAAIGAGITVGLYDWITWGSPFRSAIKFAHLTLVEPDFASRVKYQSPVWYLTNILRWLSPAMLPLLWVARRRAHSLYIIIPLVALSVVKHKELRYVQAIIPFIAVAAGIGASMLWRERRKLAMVLVAVSLVWNLTGLRYFARKSQPAVMAAQWLASQGVKRLAVSQLWAYGDRLYLGEAMDVTDMASPPRRPSEDLASADWVALWETDLDDAPLAQALAVNRFHAVHIFRDGPARAVVVYHR